MYACMQDWLEFAIATSIFNLYLHVAVTIYIMCDFCPFLRDRLEDKYPNPPLGKDATKPEV